VSSKANQRGTIPKRCRHDATSILQGKATGFAFLGRPWDSGETRAHGGVPDAAMARRCQRQQKVLPRLTDHHPGQKAEGQENRGCHGRVGAPDLAPRCRSHTAFTGDLRKIHPSSPPYRSPPLRQVPEACDSSPFQAAATLRSRHPGGPWLLLLHACSPDYRGHGRHPRQGGRLGAAPRRKPS
jgi:hypothetical protein